MNFDFEASLNKQAMAMSQAKWDAVAKPLNSLGKLEQLIVRIAGIQETENVRLTGRSAFVFCADHGVVCEGVSQSGSDVTSLVAESVAAGEANVNLMAQVCNTRVFAVDMGMKTPVSHKNIINCSLGRGTNNIKTGPAMTREQAEKALLTGMELVKQRKDAGDNLIAVGEMGIGNTTSTTAIACVLLNKQPHELTGRGAGLSDKGLLLKQEVIKEAIKVNAPFANDPIDVLCKLGGFEIAAMTGAFLGGAKYKVPIIMDGVISAVAALTATRINKNCLDFMLPSHMSREITAKYVLEELGLSPIIHADMALGEGTGAISLIPLLDMAYNVYSGVHTFNRLGMDAYTPQGGNK